MARPDILSLSEDDLATIATRGKVKEARKEIDDGRVTGSVVEEKGTLRATWSDGPTCQVAAGSALSAGRCSCNGIGVCKHLIRMAIVYQRQANTGGPPAPEQPWDPGLISDEDLGKQLRAATLTRARQLDDAGTLAELVRGTRPVARFHVPSAAVRFLVPGDLNYTHCDCARPAPCEHVALAVWAFRRLPVERRAGVVTAGAPASPVASDVLGLANSTVSELMESGISGAGTSWLDRLARVRDRCLSGDLVWPAEVFSDLILQQQSYASHDARFDPSRVAELLGELVLRLDAIAANADGLPQRLVRGSTADRPLEIEKGLFWGLGCGVSVTRKGAEVTAYLYDCKAEGVVVLSKHVEEDAGGKTSRSFVRLGGRVAVKGTSFAALGGGILQMESGRRSARHELLPGRTGVGVLVQEKLAWEEIAAPILVEEFAEIEQRLASLPPSALRPRRLAEDVHILRVAKVEGARFDVVTHTVQAVLLDRAEGRILLEHPYSSRGRSGAEALLQRLTGKQGDLLFVSGRVRRGAGGLRISPLGLVFQKGDKRDLLQPWIGGRSEPTEETEPDGVAIGQPVDVVQGFLDDVQEAIGELIVLGIARADTTVTRAWHELSQRGAAIGFAALSTRIAALAEKIDHRAHTLRWNPAPAVQQALELAALARLAADVG